MPVRARTSPGIYKTYTERYPLRLTPEQRNRVEMAAKHANKKVSDFLRDAVMVYVVGVEEDARFSRQRAEEDEERKHVKPFASRMPNWAKPRPRPEIEEEAPPAPAPPTVIVNAGAAPSGAKTDHLAEYILSSENSVERMIREREVDKILKSMKNQSEAESLARSLDEKISAGTPKKSAISWLMGE